MTTAEEVGRILAREPSSGRRVAYFCALLAREIGPGKGSLVVVGGSAIEVYTEGAYVSGDIDLVGQGRGAAIRRVLEAWGFVKSGRIWHQDSWRMEVDVIDREYHGGWSHTRLLDTPYGKIRLAAVEDLIVSRLISTKYWQLPDDLAHALMLADRYRDSLDWPYLKDRARVELVEDLLAVLQDRLSRDAHRERA